MNNYDEHTDDLLGKYLLGEATPAEISEVEAWLRQSEDNRRYLSQLKTILDRATELPQQSFNTDRAWEQVKARIDATPAQQREAKVIPMHRNRFYLRAASFAAVLFITAFVLRQYYNRIDSSTLHATNAVVVDTLKGGTIVHLNKNSTLVAKYKPRKNSQQVQLSGEAYFEIRKEAGEEFVIETQNLLIRDIGTSFNVKSDADAKQVEIMVEEGIVEVSAQEHEGNKTTVTAGNTFYWNAATSTGRMDTVVNKNALAYKTKKFRFSNVPLEQVVASLNSVYDKKIALQGDIAGCNLTISFDNEDINAITELIAETLGLKKTEAPGQIILEGTGCGQ